MKLPWSKSETKTAQPLIALANLPTAALGAGRSGNWEVLVWRTADLIGPDQWRLSGLLRGLNGTLALAGTEDSVIVLADDRLRPIPLSSYQIGVELYWQIGSAEPFLFTFSAEFEPDT